MIEFYAAVSRKDLKGFTGEGWHPEQAVTRGAGAEDVHDLGRLRRVRGEAPRLDRGRASWPT